MDERTLTLKLRGVKSPFTYRIELDEADRFRASLEDPGTGFLCLADTRGTGVVVNLDEIQFVRVVEADVKTKGPRQIRIWFRNETDAVEFTMEEQSRPEMRLLLDYLRENYDAEAFIEWAEEAGETVAVNLSEVSLMEYPSDWEE